MYVLLVGPPLSFACSCCAQTIILPHAESTREKSLQSDDVSLAYEFAKKVRSQRHNNAHKPHTSHPLTVCSTRAQFPGYTSQ